MDLSAEVVASVTEGPEPLMVELTCETWGGEFPYTWEWDFGDGG